MLDGLKRLFSGGPAVVQGGAGLASWAESRQYTFRGVRESEGFVVEGRLGAAPWRLEWGPTQRGYIDGMELRMRAELGLPSDLQAMVMNRVLQEQMERAVFDQYVEGVQTRIDTQTPPEMRWLVMFPKLGGTEMGALRERFVAVSGSKTWMHHWLEGALRHGLSALSAPPEQPVVLMIARGRLSLRTAMAAPDVQDLEMWVRLFETAMREARRVASLGSDAGAPSTQPSLWTASSVPAENSGPK